MSIDPLLIPQAPTLPFGSHLDEKTISDWSTKVSSYAENLNLQVQAALDPWNTSHSEAVARLPVIQEKVESLKNLLTDQFNSLRTLHISEDPKLSAIDNQVTCMRELLAVDQLLNDPSIERRATMVMEMSRRLKDVKQRLMDETLENQTAVVSFGFASTVEASVIAMKASVLNEALSDLLETIVVESTPSPSCVIQIKSPPTAWPTIETLEGVASATEKLVEQLSPFLSLLKLKCPIEVSVDGSKIDFAISDHLNISPSATPPVEIVAEPVVLFMEFLSTWVPETCRVAVGRVLWTRTLLPLLKKSFACAGNVGARMEEKVAGLGFGVPTVSASSPVSSVLPELRKILIDPSRKNLVARSDGGVPISDSILAATDFLDKHENERQNGLILISAVRRAMVIEPGNFFAPAILFNDLQFLAIWAAKRLQNRSEVATILSLSTSADSVRDGFCLKLEEEFAALAKEVVEGKAEPRKFIDSIDKLKSGLLPASVDLTLWLSLAMQKSLGIFRDAAIHANASHAERLEELIKGLKGLEVFDRPTKHGNGDSIRSAMSSLSDIYAAHAVLTCTRAQLLKLGASENFQVSIGFERAVPGLIKGNPKLAGALDAGHVLRLLRRD